MIEVLSQTDSEQQGNALRQSGTGQKVCIKLNTVKYACRKNIRCSIQFTVFKHRGDCRSSMLGNHKLQEQASDNQFQTN